MLVFGIALLVYGTSFKQLFKRLANASLFGFRVMKFLLVPSGLVKSGPL